MGIVKSVERNSIKNNYTKIVDYIEKSNFEDGVIVSMSAYCDSIDDNFKVYGSKYEDTYATIYLNLINNGLDTFLYLSGQDISNISIPFTHVYGYKSDRLSRTRGNLDRVARGYYDRLDNELGKSRKYNIFIEGLSIKVSKKEGVI